MLIKFLIWLKLCRGKETRSPITNEHFQFFESLVSDIKGSGTDSYMETSQVVLFLEHMTFLLPK